MAFSIRSITLYFIKRALIHSYILPLKIVKLLVTLLALNSHSAYSATDIEWAKYQFPPVFIAKGEFADKGMGDSVYRYIQQQLPDYNHSEYHSSGVRVLRDFTLKKLVCSTFTSKKGRDKDMIFSDPLTILPTQNILIAKDNLRVLQLSERSKLDGKISLAGLLKNNKDIKIGLNKLRSFGKTVNPLLKQYDANVINIDETSGLIGILKLLKNKRIDLTIEYPFVSMFVMRSAGVSLPLVIEPIAEVPEFVNAYAACSKSQQGQAVIDAINLVLTEHRALAGYREMFEQWMPDASQQAYRVGYQKFLEDNGH